VLDKVEKVLQYIAAKCGRPGSAVAVDSTFDFPVADCADGLEFEAYLSHLLNKGLIEKVAVYGAGGLGYAPTIEGWDYLEPRSPIGGTPGQCFVAMWFDGSMREAYDLGFGPGVTDAGFKPIRIDEKFNEQGNFRRSEGPDSFGTIHGGRFHGVKGRASITKLVLRTVWAAR
jgi:hypothetical protein